MNFIGCESSYNEADIVIFGAPFDGTASYRPGARFGSGAVRNESYAIETYSPYLDKDLEDLRIYDHGDLELPFGNAEAALEIIEQYAAQVFADEKIPVMLGGEHLVTLGAVRAAAKKYPTLRIIHFDAHTDLRDDYLGEKLSHATVIRRCYDILGDARIFQFGIRSGERGEFEWAKTRTRIQKFNFDELALLAKRLTEFPVYLTVDLDVLDPSEFCGTGTPEAGGVSFTQLLDAVKTVAGTNIVGFDLVELAPNLDPSGASAALACKLLREMLLMVGGKANE